jgi:hypothetical protein
MIGEPAATGESPAIFEETRNSVRKNLWLKKLVV